MPYKRNLAATTRELGNMLKAEHKIPTKKFVEKHSKGEFFPKEPAERSVEKHKRKIAAKMEKQSKKKGWYVHGHKNYGDVYEK